MLWVEDWIDDFSLQHAGEKLSWGRKSSALIKRVLFDDDVNDIGSLVNLSDSTLFTFLTVGGEFAATQHTFPAQFN